MYCDSWGSSIFDSSVPVRMYIFPLYDNSVFWDEKSFLKIYLSLCFKMLHTANHLCHLIHSFSLCTVCFPSWSNLHCSQNSRYRHMYLFSSLLCHSFYKIPNISIHLFTKELMLPEYFPQWVREHFLKR